MDSFSDRCVKAIVCLRGGYGTARLLPLLDYGLIRRNAKIFVGFSDVTSLHCAFLKKSGLISFHGPMAASHFIRKELPDFSLRSFLRTLMDPASPGGIRQGYNGKTIRILRRGMVSGPLIGGNLSVLCTLLGTSFQPAFKGRILFLEDLDEPPYRIDRMLTHLINAGALKQVAGIAVGLCENCEDPKADSSGEYRQTLQDVLKERLLPLNVPVVIGLPFGHAPHNATLPVGARATLDAERGDLIITGAVVA
jgi:muramoyltetrapeptide carboxypeptidase